MPGHRKQCAVIGTEHISLLLVYRYSMYTFLSGQGTQTTILQTRRIYRVRVTTAKLVVKRTCWRIPWHLSAILPLSPYPLVGVGGSVARWPKFRPKSSKGAGKKRVGRKSSWPNSGRFLPKVAVKGPKNIF
jgi:hypothetical protein